MRRQAPHPEKVEAPLSPNCRERDDVQYAACCLRLPVEKHAAANAAAAACQTLLKPTDNLPNSTLIQIRLQQIQYHLLKSHARTHARVDHYSESRCGTSMQRLPPREDSRAKIPSRILSPTMLREWCTLNIISSLLHLTETKNERIYLCTEYTTQGTTSMQRKNKCHTPS